MAKRTEKILNKVNLKNWWWQDIEVLEGIATVLKKNKKTVVTAESCTGGLLGYLLTGLAGSSSYYQGGFVVYSNELKSKLLDVPMIDLEQYGAVSEEVAAHLAKNCRIKLGADYGISMTGIAGPEGGTADKPVGTVWCGISSHTQTKCFRFNINGDRQEVRSASAQKALHRFLEALNRK